MQKVVKVIKDESFRQLSTCWELFVPVNQSNRKICRPEQELMKFLK